MRISGPIIGLKHIKRTSGTTTADGTPVTWGNPIRFKGVMFTLNGNEVQSYQKINVSARYKVLTNYMVIEEKDRVQFGTKIYNVKFVDDVYRMEQTLVVLLDVKKE